MLNHADFVQFLCSVMTTATSHVHKLSVAFEMCNYNKVVFLYDFDHPLSHPAAHGGISGHSIVCNGDVFTPVNIWGDSFSLYKIHLFSFMITDLLLMGREKRWQTRAAPYMSSSFPFSL